MAIQSGLISEVQQLYHSNRFLDAYERVRNAWSGPDWLDGANVEDMVWAGRLAGRLGGNKLRRVLIRTAAARTPEHPAVLLDSRWLFRRRRPTLRLLEESLARPSLDSGDSELDAQWLIDGAFFWAIVRDFHRAHQLLDQAAADYNATDSWFHSVRSHVLFCEDRWDDAAQYARKGWQASPNRPSAASYLVRVLLRLNRLDEAIDSLSVAATGQSFETLQLLAWLQCAKAERSPREIRLRMAAQANQLCQRMEDLSPLRDRIADQQIAACRFDIAMLAEDPELMQAQASKLTLPVFRQISQNLRTAPQGIRALVNYNAVFQKQDRCLPTSIASIAGTFGHTLDADALAKTLTYNGTAIWRAMIWLREHGYAVKVFILTKELCRSLLVQGVPFVYTFNTSLDNSHATAAVGLDEAAGLLLYHDPACERFGRILLDHLGESEHPLGPIGVAFVPIDRSSMLDCIQEPDARLGELCQTFWHTLAHKDIHSLAQVVAQMERECPDSPVTEAFRAYRQMLTGQLPAGITTLERLCSRYPKSTELQRMLLYGLNRTRNTARIREFLGQIIRQGRIPGISDTLPWSYPPSSCVTRYADLEGLTADGVVSARNLLLTLLERDPCHAMAYHTLGDVYMRQGQLEHASLPYRLASLLGQTDEHFARAAFDSVRLLGRQDEGLAYLRERVEKLGRLVDGGPPWATLIGALEDCGEVDEAISTATDALAARPDDPDLLVFLTRFWIRMGRWSSARTLLEQLEKCSSRSRYLEAAVYYYRYSGQWQTALELCKEWAAESTDQVEPHRMLAAILRNNQTIFTVVHDARDWLTQHKDDEDFEFIYHDQLRAAYQEDQQEEFVRARLKRNGQDTWAWRELGHLLISRAECLAPTQRGPLLQDIQRAVEQAERLAPYEAATMYLQVRLAEMQGQWEKSIELLLSSLRIEPQSSFAYVRAWENSANLPRAAQESVLHRLEEQLLLSVGPLHQARTLALNVASRLGANYAKACVERWKAQRPGDPELIEAHADVLLEYGQGRTDAIEAAAELEEALRHYPQHFDLRVALSRACGKMLQDDRKRQILCEGLTSWPLDSRVRVALASDMVILGRYDHAIKLLQEGIDLNPQDSICWLQKSWVQKESGDTPSAAQTLQQGLALLPEDVSMRRQLVRYLCELNRTPQALTVAREGLKFYPNSSVFWHMLADAMINGRTPYNAQKAEAALRKALEHNHAFYDAADLLAWLLASQYRFDEAKGAIQGIMSKLPNAGPAQGRLAWITWASGQKRPAVDQMVEALESYPDYRWGWWTLMSWLDDLDSPDLTCRILEHVPPAVRVDPDITARRLDLLGKARLSDDKLDANWTVALDDFPRNEDLRLRRFDMLADRGHWDRAKEAIEQAQSFCGQSPYILHRKVRLAIHQGNADLAIEIAMKVFRSHQPSGPQLAVWQCLVEAQLFIPAAQAIIAGVAAGEAFHVNSLCWMLEQSRRLFTVKINGKAHDLAGMLRWLAERMINCEWDSNHMVLAATLEELNTANRPYVHTFLRRNKALCKAHTRLWQAIGHYLVTGANPARARNWVSDWRDRQGVGMIAVSYYRLSYGSRAVGFIRIRSQWQSIYEASRDALNRLPEDKTILLHVAAMSEALLALGRIPEFMETIARYRNLLETADGRYWLPSFYIHENMVPRLRLLADLLQCEDPNKAIAMFIQLCQKPRQPYIHAVAFKHLGRWFGYCKRLALSAGIAGPKGRPVTSPGRILTVLSLLVWMVPLLGPVTGIAAYAVVRCSTRGWRIAAIIGMVLGLLVTASALLPLIKALLSHI